LRGDAEIAGQPAAGEAFEEEEEEDDEEQTWKSMSEEQKEAATALGWDEKTWDGGTYWPDDLRGRRWVELSGDESFHFMVLEWTGDDYNEAMETYGPEESEDEEEEE
jgi:hypothetical protein